METIRLGAQDHLVRPLQEQELEILIVIKRHTTAKNGNSEMEIASEGIEPISDDTFFVTASAALRELRAQAELLAQVNVPVLILGERGSGKEIAARLIHRLSIRSAFKFLKVNCTALPGDLLESELFGDERSALTGAVRMKAGKFEICEKGTILLDEIADMPTGVQAKLLHMLQDKQSVRLGGETKIDIDVRVLAATSVNIEQALAEKKLREDLYYRLSTFMLHVPPLRQRKDQIPLLLGHFMNQLAKHYGLPARTLSPAVIDACQCYSWPGNLRELENFVKRYLVMGNDEVALGEPERDSEITSENTHLWQTSEPFAASVAASAESEERTTGLKSLVQSVKEETERNAIAAALEQTRWNRKAAARLLKVSYRTLFYKIQQYHMSPT